MTEGESRVTEQGEWAIAHGWEAEAARGSAGSENDRPSWKQHPFAYRITPDRTITCKNVLVVNC